MQNVTPIYRFYWSWGSTRDIELETTLYCRSKLNIIIPNYSEGIPIFADTWTSISQRYPISGLFPTAHYHSLSYYPFTNPLTAKERFIKQFYWLYSIEFTSSNCLCCSLYSPLPVLYIYTIYFKLVRFIRMYKKRTRRETRCIPSSISKKIEKNGIIPPFTAKISNHLSIKDETMNVNDSRIVRRLPLLRIWVNRDKKKEKNWGEKRERTKNFIRSHIAFEVVVLSLWIDAVNKNGNRRRVSVFSSLDWGKRIEIYIYVVSINFNEKKYRATIVDRFCNIRWEDLSISRLNNISHDIV